MTVGDGPNKGAPLRSERSQVVVEVLDSVVKRRLMFQFAEPHFASLAQRGGDTHGSHCWAKQSDCCTFVFQGNEIEELQTEVFPSSTQMSCFLFLPVLFGPPHINPLALSGAEASAPRLIPDVVGETTVLFSKEL